MFYHILITFISMTAMLGACSADFSGKGQKFAGKKATQDCTPTLEVDCDPSLNAVPQPQIDIAAGNGGGNADALGGTIAGDADNVGGSIAGGSDSLGGTVAGDTNTITPTPTPKPLTDAEFGGRLINNCAVAGTAVLPWASMTTSGVYNYYKASFSKAWLKNNYPNWMYLELGGNGHYNSNGSYPATVRMAGVEFAQPPNAGYDDSIIKLARNNRYMLSKYYPNPVAHVTGWTVVNIPDTVHISADVPQKVTTAPKPDIVITFCTKTKS